MSHFQLFACIFNNVTLDFNSFTVIAVFIAVLTSFDTDRFSYDLVEFSLHLNTSLHRCARHINKDFLNI